MRPDRTSRRQRGILDAARVLRDGLWSYQVFGLQLPEEGVADFAPLYTRCCELVRECLPMLDAPSRAQVAEVLRRIEGGARPTPPAATHQLQLFTDVTLYDAELDTEPSDPELLKLFDGATDASACELGELPCIHEAIGGERPWARGLPARLVFHAPTQTLRCALAFEILTMPGEAQLGTLRRVVEEELSAPAGLEPRVAER